MYETQEKTLKNYNCILQRNIHSAENYYDTKFNGRVRGTNFSPFFASDAHRAGPGDIFTHMYQYERSLDHHKWISHYTDVMNYHDLIPCSICGSSIDTFLSYPFWFYFCLFFIVSQWALQTVYWKVLGYFTMIFHICVTRFHDSMGYDMSITIRFTWYETITVCFHLARLLHNLTA